jgi:4-diphosphocytidyl-2-C-methyl-D-erythritol kinase
MASLKKIVMQSRAKLNLFLKVLGKRPDGFHDIASIFQTIDLADELTFAIEKGRSGITIRTKHPDLPVNDDNLIVKAYKKLAEIKEPQPGEGIVCDVVKNIPIGSGMGGGSSNCAAALVALNELLDTNLEHKALMKIGAELGSDVPFFFTGGTGFIHGRGEIFEMVAPITRGGFLIVAPDVNVSTKEAYDALDSYRNGRSELISQDTNSFELQEILGRSIRDDNFESFLHNDFEDVILKKYPEIQKVRDRLERINPATRMTGSGSAVFCYFKDYQKTWESLEQYEPLEGERVFIAKPVLEGFIIHG